MRLQEILILRELALPLHEIAIALESSDRIAALKKHHARILKERNRLEILANTIATTIENREGNKQMSADELYDGFGAPEYEQEAKERWSKPAVTASNARWQALTDADRRAHLAEADDISQEFAALLAAAFPLLMPVPAPPWRVTEPGLARLGRQPMLSMWNSPKCTPTTRVSPRIMMPSPPASPTIFAPP